MQQLVIAICDQDSDYGRSLTEYWMQKREFSRVAFLEQQEDLVQRLKEERADIWLISPELLKKLQEAQKERECAEQEGLGQFSTQVICLAEETVAEELAPYPCIYKYQSADEILRRIYQNLEGQTAISEGYNYRKGRTIGLCTPWYNGSSLLAGLTLSKYLSRKGNVLYVNTRKYHGFGGAWYVEESRNLSDIIIALRGPETNMGAALKSSILAVEEVACITPVKAPRQLEGMEAEDIVQLLAAIWSELQYDYVVLEVDPELTGIEVLLEQCDDLYGFLPPSFGAEQIGNIFLDTLNKQDFKLYRIPAALHMKGVGVPEILPQAVSEQMMEWMEECMQEEEV
ncbi:MAG: hypothetical protein K2O73_03250 [Lachnospiraceae bacterium]|nr:hypothetical protein [Lachnospiraceae bacterium]MDE7435825.1 hypothetical protein [Lachnospiraceae bacterium]